MTEIHLDQELQGLRSGLAVMAGEVESMIIHTRDCYLNKDVSLGQKVLDLDQRIDQHEIALEIKAFDILALRAPFASDLRLVSSTLKIISELERIGDHCVNIAKRYMNLIKSPSALDDSWMNEIGNESYNMVHKAFDAYLSRNTELAKQVISEDDIVDNLYLKSYNELISSMTKNAYVIPQASQLILVVKNWERIADQATNIAEEVIFMVEGKNVKHSYLDQNKGK